MQPEKHDLKFVTFQSDLGSCCVANNHQMGTAQPKALASVNAVYWTTCQLWDLSEPSFVGQSRTHLLMQTNPDINHFVFVVDVHA